MKQRLLYGQLCEDCSDAPHVHRGRIPGGPQQHLRGSVPERHHLVSVNPHRNTKGPGQPKVSQLDHPFVVYQQILWFQVSVKDSSAVAKQYPFQNLVQVALHKHRVHVLARRYGIQVLF
uniref:Uncharacterized protein n=1 Tax=Anguilla anguilla TaxID=7936 RepID=A0A0E9XEZ3_ANGAN